MKKIFECLLEFLLPRSGALREIEQMTPERLRREAPRPSQNLPPDTLALFDYGNRLMRQAIWELKYRGNKKVAGLLAECLHEELLEELSERKTLGGFDKPLLIPIPLSKKRQRERGFNQCELLAAALRKRGGQAGGSGSEIFFEVRHDILAKIKNTESQTKKNRAERLKNLSDCFTVTQPEKVSGRNIILLDDVTTTGATFEEARRTLKAAGARKVLCIAVAH